MTGKFSKLIKDREIKTHRDLESKRGRPFKSQEEKRTKNLTIPLTQTEWAILEKEAQKRGMSLAPLARQILYKTLHDLLSYNK